MPPAAVSRMGQVGSRRLFCHFGTETLTVSASDVRSRKIRSGSRHAGWGTPPDPSLYTYLDGQESPIPAAGAGLWPGAVS
jgi:hypothetical protein